MSKVIYIDLTMKRVQLYIDIAKIFLKNVEFLLQLNAIYSEHL